MINKKELTGNRLKKSLNAYRVNMRWHNKNKSFSNFGFNIYFGKEFNRDTDKELTGIYNSQTNEIVNLAFGYLYQCGQKIPKEIINTDYETLIRYIQHLEKGKDWMTFQVTKDKKLFQIMEVEQ